LQALRHGAELLDEIRLGGGPLSRSLFENFNEDPARDYLAWLHNLEASVRRASSLESFACEVALSLQ
jgi:hypothetical protein